MPKISLAGFKDPVRRPRFIIWTGVVVLVLAAVVVVALGVTSTRWFCAEGCHKVQDDSIIAYERSSHSEISCMACHMPVNADPITFVLHKMEALLELYLTVTDKFELPLNPHSHVAITMSSENCTQCHNLKNREVTPSKGIKIDHEAHEEFALSCTLCHNRVAHVEDFELTLKDPKTGTTHKHDDFMSMDACFRCHSLEKDAAAPGACAACHPADFELKPDSHAEKDFYPKGHAEMAQEMKEEAAHAAEEQAKLLKEKGEKVESAEEIIEAQKKEHGEEGGHGASPWEKLQNVESVFYCSTCHTDTFCSNCHGMEMPHPTEFKEPVKAGDAAGHPAIAKTKAAKCVMCHGKNEVTHFCDTCHHGEKVGHEYDVKTPWAKQHPVAVAASGVKSCTTTCHVAKFCVDCHTGSKVVPASHKTKNWLKPTAPTVTVYGVKAAAPTATHALSAQKSVESCEVCHGTGGVNAPFCKSCHGMEMPHPAQFKEFHAKSRTQVKSCTKCHSWKETCSNCHHVGASYTASWLSVHGSSANKNGTAGCVEKCHKKEDCVKCHQSKKVVPASHDAKGFLKDPSPNKATHVQLFTSNGELCTYCHAGEAAKLPASTFCMGCHKLAMPHTLDSSAQKFPHKDGFAAKKLSKAVCLNCHITANCDSCHHKGSVANKPWLRYHPNIVKKDGATGCFECHEEVYCSACHVSLAKRGLID